MLLSQGRRNRARLRHRLCRGWGCGRRWLWGTQAVTDRIGLLGNCSHIEFMRTVVGQNS